MPRFPFRLREPEKVFKGINKLGDFSMDLEVTCFTCGSKLRAAIREQPQDGTSDCDVAMRVLPCRGCQEKAARKAVDEAMGEAAGEAPKGMFG